VPKFVPLLIQNIEQFWTVGTFEITGSNYVTDFFLSNIEQLWLALRPQII
jgi:hypothetical protein